ncbi:MAG: hypothetical protein KDD50_03840, partial [Bdellovibrionales bacterium]|nr:hypothetical protein [Bdellovibrionales bacterium]
MKRINTFLTGLMLALYGLTVFGQTSKSTNEYDNAYQTLYRVFKKYTYTLDRTLFTFRYENTLSGNFHPKNLDDLKQRLIPWSQRFYNSDIRTGDDVGPGLFSASDITITSTWGLTSPRIFALPIKPKSLFISGDVHFAKGKDREDLISILDKFKCRTQRDDKERSIVDVSSAIGAFRTSLIDQCRSLIVRVFKELRVDVINYSYESTPLPQCRSIGTAFNIINPQSIDFDQLSSYSKEYTYEGNPDHTPFLKALFWQGKDYFLAEKKLADLKTYDLYQDGYHFFDHAPIAASTQLEEWKSQHIYRCGPQWPNEKTSKALQIALYNQNSEDNPEIKDLLIRISLIYRELAEAEVAAGLLDFHKVSSEFHVNHSRFFIQLQLEKAMGPLSAEEFEVLIPKILDFYQNNDFSALARVFGESYQPSNKKDYYFSIMAHLDHFSLADASNPFLFHKVFKQSGIPQKTR